VTVKQVQVLALVVFQLYAGVISGAKKWIHLHRETVTQLLVSLWVVVTVWQSYLSPEHMVMLMLLAVQWALNLGEEVMIK
jgi:hypothetical protein